MKGQPGPAWFAREITQAEARPLVSGETISFDQRSSKERERRDIPTTPDAERWQGWGTALKPAFEPICLAQKPMTGTGPENWRAHGCGGLHVDACRVETDDALGGGAQKRVAIEGKHEGWSRPWMHNADAVSAHAARVNSNVEKAESLGRWPPNLLHDGSDEVLAAFGVFGESKTCGPDQIGMGRDGDHTNGIYGAKASKITAAYGDTGTAARFFPALPFTQDELRFHYSGKATADDRAGSKHPTIKPLALMKWLCTLITPPGGHILDPFAGSGTTGEAARLLGFDCTLIEQDASHVADINRRLGRAAGHDTPLFAEVSHA